MRMNMYIDGKKVSKKHVKEMLGESRYSKILSDAKDTFLRDPRIQNDFYIGDGILTIQFYG